MQATFNGTVSNGYDETGVFGAADPDLTGLSVTWTVIFDTSVGITAPSSEPFDQVIGGTLYSEESPVVSSVLTVGVHSGGAKAWRLLIPKHSDSHGSGQGPDLCSGAVCRATGITEL